MTRVEFDHVVTLPDGDDMFLTSITDMIVAQTAAGPVLYTASRMGGGDISAYRVAPDGSLTLIDTMGMPGNARPGVINRMELVEGPSGPQLMITGVNGTGLYTANIAADGTISRLRAVEGDAPVTLQLTQSLEINGQDFVYALNHGSNFIGVWEQDSDGGLELSHDRGRFSNSNVGLTDLEVVDTGSRPFLVASHGNDNALISYRINNQGEPIEVDRITAEDNGLGISMPTQVATMQVAGTNFAVFAASGSSSLSVVEVADDGSMTLTDHVIDTRDTRFDGVNVLETISHNGRAYIAVAGGDDGFSLFEVLMDGRLSHMGTVEDALNTTLDAVSAISLTMLDGLLHIAVTASGEAGITAFTVDVSDMSAPILGSGSNDTLTGGGGDDQIAGEGGNDRLVGGGGDDILIDGAGVDQLFGGAGADTFVLSADGEIDAIRDFDITQDSIDLSGWTLLRDISQLGYTLRDTGITLRFGDEVLTITTSDGSALTWADMEGLDLIGQSRFLPDWNLPVEPDTPGISPQASDPDPVPDPDPTPTPDPEPEPEPDPTPTAALDLTLQGTANEDVLTGELGNDTISGLQDDDSLSGRGGNDVINGDQGDDALYGNAGHDVVDGGEGNDSLWGGQGFDTMTGFAGNDLLYGGDGFDLLRGGDGNDMLTGNNGADQLYGEAGNDTLTGGLNGDSIWGGSGNDILSGSAGADQLNGDTGNDVLNGNAGADVVHGGTGNDVLSGGINHDTLHGGSGADTLNGNNGSDDLYGGGGNDRVNGNAGRDTVDGGNGNDVLFGGIGADTFIFSAGADQILDFGSVDTLVLDTDLWGGGAISFQQLSSYASVSSGDLVLNFGDGDRLVVDDAGSLASIWNDIEFV